MQALGSYEGGKMLFLGLGTGLGSTLIARRDHRADGARPPPLQETHLRGLRRRPARRRNGEKHWEKNVFEAVAALTAALEPDYVVLGGGNAERLTRLPPSSRLGDNANAFTGGFRLWRDSR